MGGAIALALFWACQSPPLVESGAGLQHESRGWSIALPPGAAGESTDGDPWRRVSVDGSVLAYRRPGPAGPIWMTLSSRCNVPLAEPRLMARHLRIGIAEHTMRESSEVEVDGGPGWQQVFDVREADAVVRIKTVTTLVDDCALDWVLSLRDGRGYEPAARDFDAWWGSFRRPESSARPSPEAGEDR